jgi:hypothetical protein
VFLFGKKRPEPPEDQKNVMAAAIAKLLAIQMALAPVGPFEVSEIEVKKRTRQSKSNWVHLRLHRWCASMQRREHS